MRNTHFEKMTVLGAATIAGALVVGGIAAGVATSHRQLQVEADGTTIVLDGFYPTVYSALKASGVEVGPHDEVLPSTDARTTNGGTISINRAQTYTVSADDAKETRWSRAQTLAAVLEDLQAGDKQSIAVSRAQNRQELPISDKKMTVELSVDGATQSVEVSGGETVEDILKKANITLSPLDSLHVTRDGGKINIVIETERREIQTLTEKIPFQQERIDDADLLEGDEVVSQEGVDGERTVRRYRQVRGGKEAFAVELSRKDTRAPQNEVVRVGTKKAPEPAPASSGSSGPVLVGDAAWDALAQCESGGNPRAVNPAGYYGLFQFDLGTWASVGGSGLPSDASPAEQLNRAKILYSQRGWQPWGCASIVGLR